MLADSWASLGGATADGPASASTAANPDIFIKDMVNPHHTVSIAPHTPAGRRVTTIIHHDTLRKPAAGEACASTARRKAGRLLCYLKC
jgi:hypothetical protein